MKAKHDKEADAIYISFNDKPYSYGRDLDKERRIDFADDGTPIGVEFLCVSEGVITDDLPYRAEVEQTLEDKGIKVYA